MKNLTEYKKAKNELQKINAEAAERAAELKKIEDAIYYKYRELQSKLTSEKYAEERELENKKTALKQQTDTNKKPLQDELKEYNKIIQLMKVYKEGAILPELKPYFYDRSGYKNKRVPLAPLSILASDKYKNICIFIYKNRKPTNKYTLCYAGFTVFYERDAQIISLPKSYGLDIRNEDNFFQIEGGIKDAATEKELIEYFEKNKGKILKEFLQEHSELEKEYEAVIKNAIGNKEWEISYLEARADYYKYGYSNYQNEPEYIKIMAELNKLS